MSLEGAVMLAGLGALTLAAALVLALRRLRGEPPLARWARGAYGLLTGGPDPGALSRGEALGRLADVWGLQGRPDALAALAAAEAEVSGFAGVRLIVLARLAVAAGWLAPDDAWARIARVARRLQSAYPDWPALAADVESGLRTWLESQATLRHDAPPVADSAARLAREVWPKVAFRRAPGP